MNRPKSDSSQSGLPEPDPDRRFRWILHIDIDQFQVAVERRRSPELRDVAVIVGGDGDPTQARKVVTCASYEARASGVRAGMPLRVAHRKMPDAIYLPTDYVAYDAASGQVMSTLREFGALEVWGADEAYLGTDTADPIAFAGRIRTQLHARTDLRCAVGISDNKQRAKMATNIAKSRDTSRIFLLDAANWMTEMGSCPVRDLFSIGSRTSASLQELGIKTVAQLAATPQDVLVHRFGRHQGLWLYVLSHGGGDASIATTPRPAKSHSKVETFPVDLTTPEHMAAELRRLTDELHAQVCAEGRVVFRVAVTVRTSNFHTRTTSRTLPEPTADRNILERNVIELLNAMQITAPVRLLGPRFDLVEPD